MDNQTIYFRKEFEVPFPVIAVTLQATCDNALTLFIDGKKVLEHGEWESPAVREMTKQFVTRSNKTGAGKHVVAVQAHNSEGPAGLLVRLVFEGKDKKLFTVVTDDSWRVAPKATKGWQARDFDAREWKPAVVVDLRKRQ